jgi:LacI family transcriptional regulator, gluconate utilization system Gnt-I transcriptional repressor
MQNCGAPVVKVMDIDGAPIDIAVEYSNKKAAEDVASRMLDFDCRRIGYVAHDVERDLRAMKRRDAFMHTMMQYGRPCVGEVVVPEPSSVSAGRLGLARLLSAHPDLDAVYFSSNDMAIGGMFHCQATGARVPEQLAVVGYYGLGIGQAIPQPLATTLTPRTQIGAVAARCVLERLAGRAVPTNMEVAYEFVAGATM